MNEPDAGATRYFVVIFKTFVNFSFHASAKKLLCQRTVVLIIVYGAPAELRYTPNAAQWHVFQVKLRALGAFSYL